MNRSARIKRPLARWLIQSFIIIAMAVFFTGPTASFAKSPVVELQLDGVISPASSDFIVRGLDRAANDQAQLVVITLDTPGGLDASMRGIVKAILASPDPEATYVAPSGARAASAGTFILYASHIAAMAPASNIGAATPVQIGGGGSQPADTQDKDHSAESSDASGRKARNDAAAYIRSLAQLRDRNPEFAEQAVLDAASMSAQEALEGDVIDIVAASLPELLEQIDGRAITLQNGQTANLDTAGVTVEQVQPDWRTKLLLLIANPQVAVILMMIGVYGLFYEVTSPGLAGPGVAGLICLLLAFYAFQLLPVNWVGVGLIFMGLSLMVAEVFLPSFGMAGAGGVAAFVLGGIFLTDSDMPAFSLGLPFIIGSALFSVALLLVIGRVALRSHRHRVVSGAEYMMGQTAVVKFVEQGITYADVQGELWKVRSNEALHPGQQVRIVSIDGLTLGVVAIERVGDDSAQLHS